MDISVYGENLGINKKQDKWIKERLENCEDFGILNPELHIARNKINPSGFFIEDGEDLHSIRITVDCMKFIMKHIIDDL